MRWLRWLLAAVAAVVVLAVGGTFVYIHFIEGPAPAPLSLGGHGEPVRHAGTGVAGGHARPRHRPGPGSVATGSQAGYRVKEVLLGQNNVAVGRTSHSHRAAW